MEIKFANQMNANKIHAISGQISEYKDTLCQNKNYNPKSFILLMVGDSNEQNTELMKQVFRVSKKNGAQYEYFICK